MSLIEEIAKRYPNAREGENYEIVDEGDGVLKFRVWNVLDDEGNPVPGPSSETLHDWLETSQSPLSTQRVVAPYPWFRATLGTQQRFKSPYAYTRVRLRDLIGSSDFRLENYGVVVPQTGIYQVNAQFELHTQANSLNSYFGFYLRGREGERIYLDQHRYQKRFIRWSKLMQFQAGDELHLEFVTTDQNGPAFQGRTSDRLEGIKIA